MYLAPHVRTLYTQIRNRALIQVGVGRAGRLGVPWSGRQLVLSAPQYFSPYVSADMHKMAAAFNTTVAALEDELTQLILEGLINARIDSHSKVATGRGAEGACWAPVGPAEPVPAQILYARDVDQRSTTFEKSLLMGKEFQRRAKAMILRAAVLRNQIHVKVSSWGHQGAGSTCAAPG